MGWYSFDTNSIVQQNYENGTAGTNITNITATMKWDGSTYLLGTGAMQFPNINTANMSMWTPYEANSSGQLTISAWFYLNGSGNMYEGLGFGSFENALSLPTILIRYTTGGGLQFMVASAMADYKYATFSSVPSSKWIHVAFVLNGTGLTAYYNNTGTSSFTSAGAGADLTTAGGTGRFIFNHNAGTTYTGQMDEVAIYRRALTAAEITALWGNGTGYKPTFITPPSTDVNFTLTASNKITNESLTTFQAVINGTTYNTTNGTIYTNINNATGHLINITADCTYCFNAYATNLNVSVGTYNISILPYLNVTATEYITNNPIQNFSVEYAGTNYTTTYYWIEVPIIYIDGSGYWQTITTSSTYLENMSENSTTRTATANVSLHQVEATILTTDTNTNYVQNFTVNTTYATYTTTTGTLTLWANNGTYPINWSSPNYIQRIGIYELDLTTNATPTKTITGQRNKQLYFYNNYTAAVMTPNCEYSGQSYNSHNINVTTYWQNLDLNCTSTYFHNYTTTLTHTINSTENHFLEPYKLILYFKNKDTGSLQNTTGTVCCIEDTTNNFNLTLFNNTNIVVLAATLVEGKTSITYNLKNYTAASQGYTNATQFYEYINTDEGYEYVEQSLYLIDQEDQIIYLKILDATKQTPIENAYIQVRIAEPINVGSNNPERLIGQRLSDTNGETFIIADTGTTLKLSTIKEGYSTQIITGITEDFNDYSTEDNPLVIYLSKTNTISTGWYSLYCPTYYDQETTIRCSVGYYIPTDADVQIGINTDYREALGGTAAYSMYASTLVSKTYYYDFNNGTDYTTGNNFIVKLYIDGTNEANLTITSISEVAVFDQDEITGLLTTGKTPIILLAIGIIVLASLAGTFFIGTNVGYYTLIIGTIIATTLNPAFIIAGLLAGAELIGTAIRKYLQD